jgi:salicylate biosynthesis isochorismate synthase
MSGWSRSRRTTSERNVVRREQLEQGFGPAAYELLAGRIDAAARKARVRGRTIVASVTVPLAGEIDPLEHVRIALAPGERWSYFERPARVAHAVATLGETLRVTAAGADRFVSVAEQCASALDAAETGDSADDPGAPAGAGPTWFGGFAFFDNQAHGDAWRHHPAAEFVLPAISLVRAGERDPVSRLTINVGAGPGDRVSDLLANVEDVVERLEFETAGAGATRPPASASVREDAIVSSSASPEHYEQAVARAVEMIRAGELDKIVLAREVLLRRKSRIDPFAAVCLLRDRFPECATFAIGGENVFLGATPELLIRREGRRASTLALAGSERRGADAATDEHLGRGLLASEKNNREHAIVVRSIELTLGRLSAWTAVGERPELVKMANIQHLATPIRAQLTEPRSAIELAGLLHPTPAVGGEPWHAAGPAIRSLEGFDRGWYTGGVGWMDRFEDGEFHVALRSALVEGTQARLFAGAGIVRDSDPAAELAETETKLAALLPVLSRC